MSECLWEQDSDGNWFTACNNGFIIGDGTPSSNGMKYCCYCGKELREVPYVEEGADFEGEGE